MVIAIMGSNFTCYWDESGTDPGTLALSKSKREILVVAGYLAHVDDWESLESRWSPIIKKENLDRFHMAAFCNLRRPYGGWTEERRNGLIESLLEILRDCPRLYVAFTLRIDDYMNLVKARNIGETDFLRAYHILGLECIRAISALALSAGYTEKILHVFDQGNAAWPTFEASFTPSMLDALNILRPTSQSNIDVPALQAADILVHQVARLRTTSTSGAIGHQRIYADRLKFKAGFDHRLTKGEILKSLQENERFRQIERVGMPQHLTLNAAIPQQHQEMMKELFSDPKEFSLNERLRSLQ